MIGLNGNDELNGGVGNDRLEGGAGNDLYIVTDASSDRILDLSGAQDVLRVSSNKDLQSSQVVGKDLILTFTNNTFQTTTVTIENHFGAGTVESLTDATGQSVVLATGLVGGDKSGIITGTDQAETLDGRGGDDLLFGNGGRDTLLGGDGNDYIDGGTGADKMNGGTGNDTFIVDKLGDVVVENRGEGIDEIRSSVSILDLADNVENLTLLAHAHIGVGNSLNNTIIGNAGSNVLFGRDGKDILDGGDGFDILWGGDGKDTFRFARGEGPDIVSDFERADTIALDRDSFGIASGQQIAEVLKIGGNAPTSGAKFYFSHDTLFFDDNWSNSQGREVVAIVHGATPNISDFLLV